MSDSQALQGLNDRIAEALSHAPAHPYLAARDVMTAIRPKLAELAQIRGRLARVQELHQPAEGHSPPWCKACDGAWPCRTSRVLDGDG